MSLFGRVLICNWCCKVNNNSCQSKKGAITIIHLKFEEFGKLTMADIRCNFQKYHSKRFRKTKHLQLLTNYYAIIDLPSLSVKTEVAGNLLSAGPNFDNRVEH